MPKSRDYPASSHSSMDLPNRVPIPIHLLGSEQRSTNEQKLQHSGRIPYFTFQINVKANRYALSKKSYEMQ